MPLDSHLVPVARHREHAYAIALHAATRLWLDHLEQPDRLGHPGPDGVAAVMVAALADDGVIVELALRRDPDDGAEAVVELLRVNHRDHDFPAWGYFVASLLSERADDEHVLGLLAALPGVHELDRVDAAASDVGVEVLDWLVIIGDRGVSLFEALGRGWRWIDREEDPSRSDAP